LVEVAVVTVGAAYENGAETAFPPDARTCTLTSPDPAGAVQTRLVPPPEIPTPVHCELGRKVTVVVEAPSTPKLLPVIVILKPPSVMAVDAATMLEITDSPYVNPTNGALETP